MRELVNKIKGIVVMPEFEDSRAASMWQFRFNPFMLVFCALTK